VVVLPKEIRIPRSASVSDKPKCNKTLEAVVVPLEQALPAEIAKPAKSACATKMAA